MKLDIRPLDKNDDIRQVAGLIMATDPYLYSDLFGSYENAVRVLPYLFKRDKGMFRRSAYYLAVSDDKIVGIAALFKAGNEWNTADVRAAFFEAGVALPESFEEVCRYFVRVHNYNDDTKACNICVREDMRGKGIGGKLVDFMIKAAGNSDIRLGVLVSNTAAVRLYRSRGFEILYEIDDYGGYKKPAVKVYEMIRLYDKAYSDNRQ